MMVHGVSRVIAHIWQSCGWGRGPLVYCFPADLIGAAGWRLYDRRCGYLGSARHTTLHLPIIFGNLPRIAGPIFPCGRQGS
jgi:hypothetical protein